MTPYYSEIHRLTKSKPIVVSGAVSPTKDWKVMTREKFLELAPGFLDSDSPIEAEEAIEGFIRNCCDPLTLMLWGFFFISESSEQKISKLKPLATKKMQELLAAATESDSESLEFFGMLFCFDLFGQDRTILEKLVRMVRGIDPLSEDIPDWLLFLLAPPKDAGDNPLENQLFSEAVLKHREIELAVTPAT